jgi:hypothetical protein
MGLMSIVNSLASSPIGKVAGGFLEGEIDERKEAARLQEEKDKRYANITDGLVNNLLTIEANVIANATRESNIYDEAKNWAIGKFGDGGLAVVERMRQDGLFSGAQDLNSVLTNSNNMYGAGLPEGSEPWYQQPEWQEFSTSYKDYTAPTNTYQNRINQSYGTIGNILKDNGIGDFTFDLFTNAKQQQSKNPNVPAEGTITETGPDTSVEKESASAENIIDINTLGTAPTFGERGIQGYSETNFSKAKADLIERQYPQFDQMFITDMAGNMTFNKGAFAGDINKVTEVGKAETYLENTLMNSRNLYQTGKLKTNNDYNKFYQFFNKKDFDERGFVSTALNDYFDTISKQKSELIKMNVLKSDLRNTVEDGTMSNTMYGELSNYLDEVFPYSPGDANSWENLYLRNVGLENSTFKQAYNKAVTDFMQDKMRLSGASHSMQFIDPTATVEEVLKGKTILEGMSKENLNQPYLQYYSNSIQSFVDGDFGTEPISTFLNRISPENYADIQSINLQFNNPELEFEMLTPTDTTIDAEAYRPANITAIAETKQSRTNVTIPGLPEVASSILANTNMTTQAQVLSWMQSLNGDLNAMRQAVIGIIVNDIQAGNIDNIPSAQIIDLADQVLLDLGTFASDQFTAGAPTGTDEITASNETIATIENDNTTANEAIEKEEKDADDKLSESMQENFDIKPIIETEENKGVGEDPWLFADGSFNPDWDASDLDMDTRYQFGSEANKYNRARMAYEKMKSQEKFNETAGKIFKFIKDNAILDEGEKYNDNK